MDNIVIQMIILLLLVVADLFQTDADLWAAISTVSCQVLLSTCRVPVLSYRQ